MACNRCLFILLFTIPTIVVLPIFIGVADWGCPSSANESQIMFAYFALRNIAPSSASTADDATCFIIVHYACIGPFKSILVLFHNIIFLPSPRLFCSVF